MDTYLRATVDAQQEFVETTEKMKDKGTDAFESLENAVKGYSRSFADAMMNNEKGFSGFVDTVLKELQRIAIAEATQPLFDALSGIIGDFGSSLFGGGGNPAANAVPDGTRAAGGPVHAGKTYLVNERGPELITMGGNGYVTPNKDLGGDVTVNVINQGGSQVDVQDRGKKGGSRTIDVIVMDSINKAIESGRMDRPLKNAYGITRKGG